MLSDDDVPLDRCVLWVSEALDNIKRAQVLDRRIAQVGRISKLAQQLELPAAQGEDEPVERTLQREIAKLQRSLVETKREAEHPPGQDQTQPPDQVPAAVATQLQGMAGRLAHWGEHRMAGELDEVRAALADDTAALADRLETIRKRLVGIEDRLRDLVPLRTKLAGPVAPAPKVDSSNGVVICLWLGFTGDGGHGDTWRLVRREINALGGILFQPFDTDAKGAPEPIMIDLVRPGDPNLYDPAETEHNDPLSSKLYASWLRPSLVVPASATVRKRGDSDLLHGSTPWRPDSHRAEGSRLAKQAIGYFLVPFPVQEAQRGDGTGAAAADGPDPDHEAVMRTLVRLAWGLSGDSVAHRDTLDPEQTELCRTRGLYYRMFTFPVRVVQHEAAAQDTTAAPHRIQTQGGVRIVDHRGMSVLLESVLRDATTENCIVAHPDLVKRAGRAKDWFTFSWPVPAWHRQGRFCDSWEKDAVTQASSQRLLASPAFNGLPGWEERNADPAVNERRRAARLRLYPPRRATLRTAAGSTFEGYLIDYGTQGCRVDIPSDQPDSDGARLQAALRDAAAELEVHCILDAPWPEDDDGPYDQIVVDVAWDAPPAHGRQALPAVQVRKEGLAEHSRPSVSIRLLYRIARRVHQARGVESAP